MQTPIYVKSSYNFLSSLITIDDLVSFAIKNKLNSLCLCDDNMFGVMEFILKCQDNNINPIVGLDFGDYLLYAKDYNGYQNLLKLNTLKSENNIDISNLSNYSNGLICVILNDNLGLEKIFRDCYLGIDSNLNLRRVDAHKTLCFDKKDLIYLKYLNMLRDNKTLSDDYLFNEDSFYQEINDLDIINNTNELINYCHLILPKYELNMPDYSKYNDTKGLSNDLYLENLSISGLNKRLNNKIPESYKKRLLYELNIIKEMGYSNYFLIVYDFIKYAKNNNILVGPGRGSACSSLVSFSLGITDIDPLKYNLLFERFLNPERVTMPDIDTDFPDIKREEVINYVTNKYGKKNVSLISTFVPFGSKMALRDMGRVLNVSSYLIDELSKTIGNDNRSLKEIYESNEKFRLLINNDLKLKELFKVASKIEGMPRHNSIHAAGVIMANSSLDDIIPLTINDSMYVSCYEAGYLENLGLLKMDFLGIRNLTIIDDVIHLINEKEHLNLKFNDILFDDKKTYELLSNGDTLGIFQFESKGMQDFLKKLKPNCFSDLYNANAMYRPGPSENIPLYIKRKNREENIDYIDLSLKDILSDTYGIIVYQEQIMLIANKMASFSLGEADILRRAMSKKKVELLDSLKEKFINNSIKNGYSMETSSKVYNLIMEFASYGFAKSHSVTYSVIAYRMAYLKANYPKYFYLVELNNLNSSDKEIYFKELKKKDIKFIKPDINYSSSEYHLYNNKIILPFTVIKGISKVLSDKIIDIRKDKFNSVFDFFSLAIKNKFTKNNLELLIYGGVFDSLNYNRKTLISNLDKLINYGNLLIELGEVPLPELDIVDEYTSEELISLEKESFGFYLTNHPVSIYKSKSSGIINLVDIKNSFNKNIIVIGLVDKINEINTKNKEKMAFLNISDEEASLDLVLFPKVYLECNFIKRGSIYKFYGRVEKRNDYQLVVSKVEEL